MTETNNAAEGSTQFIHQVQLPLSKQTVEFVAGLIRSRRTNIRSRWRSVSPGRQAVVVLAVLRHDQRLCDLAGGSAVSASTIRRWTIEVITLLAARAPRLERALKKIRADGGEAVLLDGALVRTRRRTGSNNRRNYSSKTQGPRPAVPRRHRHPRQSVVDLGRAARRLRRTDRRPPGQDHCSTARGRPRRDDGPGTHRVGGRSRRPGGRHRPASRSLTPAQKEANRFVGRERAANEHGFSDLKNWRILTRLRMNAQLATTLLRALLVLIRLEVNP